MLSRKERRKTSLVVRVLSLLIPILLIGLLLLLRDIAGFRVGSDTEYGAVYRLKDHGVTGYQWYIFNADGTVREQDLTIEKPYIYQEGNRITLILQENGGIYHDARYRNYDLDSEEITEIKFNPPTISQKLKVYYCRSVKIDSGLEYAEFYRLTNPDMPTVLYSWIFYDDQGEELWRDYSITEPEVIIYSDDEYGIFYQDEDEDKESVMLFNPLESDFSHDYHLDENGTVFIEQAIGWLNFWGIKYADSIAQTENFINTDACEMLFHPDDAYFRAKQEVTISYSLVTFRSDVHISEEECWFNYWEVTFSQKDDPEGQMQTVYMTGDGITLLILNGKPLE